LIDTASADARTLSFLIDTMGEQRMVFGSDYCGGLGPLKKSFAAIEKQADPDRVKSFTEKNSRELLHI
jgi:predicted TIM-barrel fold metal-dependent hydrolase